MKAFLCRMVFAICMSAAFLACALFAVPTARTASANSAQSWFHGVDSAGVVLTDKQSPIVVEGEKLTFYIEQFPQPFVFGETAEEYACRVTAQYTFHNPSQYTVTCKLLFPFGTLPDYANAYYDGDGNYVRYDDTDRYAITVDGQEAEKGVRYTLSGGQFDLAADIAYICDDYIADDFYSPDTPVTAYSFSAVNVDHANYPSACAAFDVTEGQSDYRYVLSSCRGCHITDDGAARLIVSADSAIELYVIGTPPDNLPKWKIYKNGGAGDGDEIDGNVVVKQTQTMTFKEFALGSREEDSPVSEVDWYNAVVADLNSDKSFPLHPIAFCDAFDNALSSRLMRWYEYYLTFAPGQRIVNAVTAPLYPAVDTDYDPDIYEYTYLLSPASTWKDFGELEIVINTPYYITKNSIAGFESVQGGYGVTLPTLPNGELVFTLSSSPDPQLPAKAGWLNIVLVYAVLAVAAIVLVIGAVIVVVLLVVRHLGRRTKGG